MGMSWGLPPSVPPLRTAWSPLATHIHHYGGSDRGVQCHWSQAPAAPSPGVKVGPVASPPYALASLNAWLQGLSPSQRMTQRQSSLLRPARLQTSPCWQERCVEEGAFRRWLL